MREKRPYEKGREVRWSPISKVYKYSGICIKLTPSRNCSSVCKTQGAGLIQGPLNTGFIVNGILRKCIVNQPVFVITWVIMALVLEPTQMTFVVFLHALM